MLVVPRPLLVRGYDHISDEAEKSVTCATSVTPQPHQAAPSLSISGLSAAGSGVSQRAEEAQIPCKPVVDRSGFEPLTSAVQGRRSPN